MGLKGVETLKTAESAGGWQQEAATGQLDGSS